MNGDAEAVEQEIHGTPARAEQELRKIRKEQAIAEALAKLRAAGILWDSKQGGMVLIIRRTGATFEFWPGTGRWRQRDTTIARERIAYYCRSRRGGHGVDELIRAIGSTK